MSYYHRNSGCEYDIRYALVFKYAALNGLDGERARA